jgi:hypothetical protein
MDNMDKGKANQRDSCHRPRSKKSLPVWVESLISYMLMGCMLRARDTFLQKLRIEVFTLERWGSLFLSPHFELVHVF